MNNSTTPQKSYGLSLMDFLISTAILAIISTIAIPTYLHYSKKSYYVEVVQAAHQYKISVTLCIKQTQGVLAQCDAGAHGIPPNVSIGNGQVASVVVENGVIIGTPKEINGISMADNYVLTPVYHSNPHKVSWKASGGSCVKGLSDC